MQEGAGGYLLTIINKLRKWLRQRIIRKFKMAHPDCLGWSNRDLELELFGFVL
jgi:hypothetical protein